MISKNLHCDSNPSANDVIGVDHIYMAVTDLRRAEKFYDAQFENPLAEAGLV